MNGYENTFLMHTISHIYILSNICKHTIITTRWQTSLSVSSQLQWTCQSQSRSKRWRCVPVDVTSQLHLKTPELCSDRHHSVLFCSFLWRSSEGDFFVFHISCFHCCGFSDVMQGWIEKPSHVAVHLVHFAAAYGLMRVKNKLVYKILVINISLKFN